MGCRYWSSSLDTALRQHSITGQPLLKAFAPNSIWREKRYGSLTADSLPVQGEGRLEGPLPGPPPQQQQQQQQPPPSQPQQRQPPAMPQRANSAGSGVSNGGGGRRGGASAGGGQSGSQGQRRNSGAAPAPQHMPQVMM